MHDDRSSILRAMLTPNSIHIHVSLVSGCCWFFSSLSLSPCILLRMLIFYCCIVYLSHFLCVGYLFLLTCFGSIFNWHSSFRIHTCRNHLCEQDYRFYVSQHSEHTHASHSLIGHWFFGWHCAVVFSIAFANSNISGYAFYFSLLSLSVCLSRSRPHFYFTCDIFYRNYELLCA